MTTVTVVRRVPPPLVGVCGIEPDRAFEALERTLEWLESTGVLVERVEPSEGVSDSALGADIADHLARAGESCLPLILVDDVVVSAGVRPTRSRLARLVGRSRLRVGLSAAVSRPDLEQRGD